MRTRVAVVLAAVAVLTAQAEVRAKRGAWDCTFNGASGLLRLDCPEQGVVLEGRLGFEVDGTAWRIAEPRDAVTDRLAILSGVKDSYPVGTVRGYVTFRADGNRLEMTVMHRAGANFFPGRLRFDGRLGVRGKSFPCRTSPGIGERVISFADGTGDSAVLDSVFVPETDLAVRFLSSGTVLQSNPDGSYAVHLEAVLEEPAKATVVLTADRDYFASRWVPAYRTIDRRRCPRAPTGWMSWNTYFDKAGAAENLAEARIGAKYLKPFGLDIWSIESWQENSDWLPVANFHNLDLSCSKTKFPEGMRKLADDLRALGFTPGLWMPLYGTGDKAFYESHREMFLHDAKGSPVSHWCGKYVLDITRDDSLALMRDLARTAAEKWGYEFFKFDAMGNYPRLFEHPERNALFANPNPKWWENSVRVLREAIGENRLFLGCMGDLTGTEARYLDASRTGGDVVGCYMSPVEHAYPGMSPSRWCQMPVRWENVLKQAKCTLEQVFVNNIVFYTDPDTLLVNESLERHEAEVMATIVALPGQLMFAGDRLGELKPGRMKIIQQVLPVADIHPQNLYPYSASAMLPVWNLSVMRPFGRWNVVALFNWTDGPQEIAATFAELGLDAAKEYVGYEFWGQEDLGVLKDGIRMDVPMRSVKLVAVREKADHPQFIGDDRHITQGAVELEDLKWDEASCTYRMKVKAIGGFPFAYSIRIPEGYSFKSCDGAKATVVSGIVRVAVTSEASRTVEVSVRFGKGK